MKDIQYIPQSCKKTVSIKWKTISVNYTTPIQHYLVSLQS